MKIVYQGAEVETSAATVAGFLAERGVDAAKALVEYKGEVHASGEGLDALREAIASRLAAHAASGDEPQAEASARRGELLGAAREALMRAVEGLPDLVLAANGTRAAAESLGRLAGKVYADDLLDSLFSRFCIGK